MCERAPTLMFLFMLQMYLGFNSTIQLMYFDIFVCQLGIPDKANVLVIYLFI